jgi:trans-aconitate 2-methyltransferase
MTRESEWSAAGYTRISALQQQMAADALALVSLAGIETVLDVGCGQGRVTAGIAARVPHGRVVGVDPSHDMIEFAKAHYEAPNLRFEVGDARMLGFAAEYDRVVSFNALHWVPDQDAALQSIGRALAPDGRALLRLVPMGERTSLETIVEETRKSPRWRAAFAGFADPYLRLTPDQYRETAERNGFRVNRLECSLHEWDFGTRDAFFAFCAVGLIAWTSRLPQHDRAPFIDEVLTRYAEDSSGAKSPHVFSFYQMNVELAPRA